MKVLEPSNQHQLDGEAFLRLLRIMDELREQCPWDKKQTFLTLRPLSIEECYELCDAILKEDVEGIKEEVGDLMLHMVFYARIAREQGAWTMAESLHALCEKLIHRHPHIYGDVVAEEEETVKKNWVQLNLTEGKKSVIEGVPTGLPGGVKALRLQRKTAQVGFDWPDKESVWKKCLEEIDELREAIRQGRKEAMEDELGDVLFSLVNYARVLHIDPETALERTNQKFMQRFRHIESQAKKPLEEMTLAEMDVLWEEAKKH